MNSCVYRNRRTESALDDDVEKHFLRPFRKDWSGKFAAAHRDAEILGFSDARAASGVNLSERAAVLALLEILTDQFQILLKPDRTALKTSVHHAANRFIAKISARSASYSHHEGCRTGVQHQVGQATLAHGWACWTDQRASRRRMETTRVTSTTRVVTLRFKDHEVIAAF